MDSLADKIIVFADVLVPSPQLLSLSLSLSSSSSLLESTMRQALMQPRINDIEETGQFAANF